MKKYIKIISLVLIALIFIGTFVFLYQKSQPKDTTYDILRPKTTDKAHRTKRKKEIKTPDATKTSPKMFSIISKHTTTACAKTETE